MEPLAPGTEDDPLYTQVAKPSKKETSEEQALSKKAFLANGIFGNIFELNYVQGAQHWYCKVCDCPVLGRLFNHEIGKRHTGYLDKYNKNADFHEKYNATTSSGEANAPDVPIVIAPGEPLPPGFEGEVEKTTLIQDRLDGFNAGPLVGLEYLLELLDYDPTKEPNYLCILCDKKGDPRTVLTHLSSYNHQITYLQKFFPTAYRHIAPYMIKAYKRNWQSGLQRIAEAIESTFGRLKPMQVEAGKFEKDRMHYIEIVAKGKHFNELSGHTFENVVTKEELIKVHEETKAYDVNMPFRKSAPKPVPKRKSPSPPIVARPIKRQKPTPERKRRSLSPVSDISSSDLDDFDPKPSKKSQKEEKISTSKIRESYDFSRKEKPSVGRRRSLSPKRRDGSMPWQKSNYGRGKLPSASEKRKDDKIEKLDEYKKLAKAIENDMEQVLKKHRQNPEKHSKYNDEWKKFWNIRYKELQSEGKNAAAHDFKPEWIEFWNKRMLELHQEEIKSKKIALRKRLGLPEEPTPISFKIGERRKMSESNARENKPVPTAAQPDSDPEVIVIEDNDKDFKGAHSPSRNRRRSKSPGKRRDHSPQFRRRSPPSRRQTPQVYHNDLSPRRSRKSSPLRNRFSSPRRVSPSTRRVSPPARRVSPQSPLRRRSSEKDRGRDRSPAPLQISPPPRMSPSRRSSPTSKRDLRYSPPARGFSMERSPGPDRFGRSRDLSNDRSRSRGKDLSWERERERFRDYDDTPWDRLYRGRGPAWENSGSWDRYPSHVVDIYAPPKVMRDVTREPVRDVDVKTDEDENVNIVAVLRLLTALEERLGSLGPKVIELLGQALAMEKKSANSSEELLDSEINCVLFETVKEKLKGQLQAGLVDRYQEKAFKRAIKQTASLIHLASERKKQREVELPKKPMVVPGVGTVDKGKIARQIANALIAQGKTDVTQVELEQLINAVVGIAEAQKGSSQPMTTASFLEKLSKSSLDERTELERKVEKKENENSKENKKEEGNTIIEKPVEEETDASNSSLDKSSINMEGLSDSDLQTLLQNFKDLSTDEQHGLINYLKKLEAKEPERVEKLRKFVNFSENVEKAETERYSPFSKRISSVNPVSKELDKDTEGIEKNEDKTTSAFIDIDSEDEDYTFEDVAKAASQKVIEKEMEQKRMNEETKKENEDKSLHDTKALITSLMSSLNRSTVTSLGSNSNAAIKTETTQSAAGKINIISDIPVSSADLAKSLSGITMSISSLGSILGNVQNLTRQNQSKAQEVKSVHENRLSPDSFSSQSVSQPLPRKAYNEFDISSQRDVRSKADFKLIEPEKGRTNKVYDEFNIGPNPGELKSDKESCGRGSGFGPNREMRESSPVPLQKSLGFSERGNILPNMSPQDRNLSDRNLPYSDMGGSSYRGNPNQRGPFPLFSNVGQYLSRGTPSTNNIRLVGNSFECREFNLDRGTPERGIPNRGISDRGALERGSKKGMLSEPRRVMSDFRMGMSDLRGSSSSDFHDGQDNFCAGRSDYRGRPDDIRNSGEFRGEFGVVSRGGQQAKGGMLIDPNRLGSAAPPRYLGNFEGSSNFNNSYKRW